MRRTSVAPSMTSQSLPGPEFQSGLLSFCQGEVSIYCHSLHVPPHNLSNHFSKNIYTYIHSPIHIKAQFSGKVKSKYINFKRHIKKKKPRETIFRDITDYKENCFFFYVAKNGLAPWCHSFTNTAISKECLQLYS